MFHVFVIVLKKILPAPVYKVIRYFWRLWVEKRYFYYKNLGPEQFEKALKKWYKSVFCNPEM